MGNNRSSEDISAYSSAFSFSLVLFTAELSDYSVSSLSFWLIKPNISCTAVKNNISSSVP